MTKLTAEEIEINWNKFVGLCGKLGDRTEKVQAMLDVIGENLCLCPASSKLSFHSAFPGGLVYHSLNVLENAIKLCQTFKWKVAKESLILSCLFHDIGKCGFVGNDGKLQEFYLVQNSEWHREKMGEEYKFNDDIPYMTTPHRSVYLMQHFDIKLSHEEFLAILLNDGFSPLENKPYSLKEPMLATIVMQADYLATISEKNDQTQKKEIPPQDIKNQETLS